MKHILDTQVVENLVKGRYLGDAFSVLGMHHAMHEDGHKFIFIRTLQPQAKSIEVINSDTGASLGNMRKVHSDGLFQLDLPQVSEFFSYSFKITLYNDAVYQIEDTYRFWPVLGDMDLYLFGEGTHYKSYEKLGAHLINHQGVDGVSFAVWAPNAKRVSVVGSFNDWDGRRHLMRPRGSSGIWEIFIPGLKEWDMYKYEIVGANGDLLPLKIDPVGFAYEMRPKTGTLVFNRHAYEWQDNVWVNEGRRKANDLSTPISIYEVHFGSWRRNSLEGNRWLTYREMAEELPIYVKYMGYTHVEFLPLAEYPFDGSWGYQSTGLYAPTSRYGTPNDFKYLIDKLHEAGIGVIMDWVPAHFPKDAFGLCQFDGTALYEHADPKKGEHKDWGTKIYNYSRAEVANFLLSNALFWIREYHIDALRVDAVASMLYLDYSRKEGEWIPNEYGGRECIEAIHFLRRLNELVFGENNGATTFAEESTSWPMVSRPTYIGGLGFGYKWNMGWMHDTLKYISEDPIHRKYHHNQLTFSMIYAWTENFALPISHDEVVHGKGAMLNKMPGDEWQKFANLRAYYTYMFTHPGKKLLFMGNELAEHNEWKFADSLNWDLLFNNKNKGIQTLIKDLNELYKAHSSLHQYDHDPKGFEWIDGGDAENSCISFMRKSDDETLIVACNFTPVPRHGYRLGVNEKGTYKQIFNSDDLKYAGSGVGSYGDIYTADGWHFKPYAITVDLPPLATVVFKKVSD